MDRSEIALQTTKIQLEALTVQTHLVWRGTLGVAIDAVEMHVIEVWHSATQL